MPNGLYGPLGSGGRLASGWPWSSYQATAGSPMTLLTAQHRQLGSRATPSGNAWWPCVNTWNGTDGWARLLGPHCFTEVGIEAAENVSTRPAPLSARYTSPLAAVAIVPGSLRPP